MTVPTIPLGVLSEAERPQPRDATAVALRGGPAGQAALDKILPPSQSDLRDRLVAEAARRHAVPVDLAIAVSHVENWRGLPQARSSAGAVGLMQVMPDIHGSTARELEDPGHNVELGVKILRMYYDRYGSWEKALRAYNGSLKLPRAGDRYVAQVRAAQMKIGGRNAEGDASP